MPHGRREEEIVEELSSSNDDSETHGAGLAVGQRIPSDPLLFNSVDLADRGGRARMRRRRGYREEEEDDDDDDGSSEDDSEEDSEGEDLARLTLSPEEEAIANKALAKVRKAQAKGRKDVKLKTEEYAVLMKRKDFKDAMAKRRNEVMAPIGDVLPHHPSPEQLRESQRIRELAQGPPMGYFPPTSSRPRSGTASTSSRPPSRSTNKDRRSSPFRYSYVQQPPHAGPPSRHVSDPAAGRPLSRGPVPPDQAWAQNAYASAPSLAPRQSQIPLDPFQYMTGAVQAAYHNGPQPPGIPSPHVGATGRRESLHVRRRWTGSTACSSWTPDSKPEGEQRRG